MKKAKLAAFTLIELLIVIVIIGILSAIGVASFTSYQAKARQAKINAEYWQSHQEQLADCVSNEVFKCNSEVTINGVEISGMNAGAGEMVFGSQALSEYGTEKWCYNDDIENCRTEGGLYTWYAAQNACPSGWHLPTIIEANSVHSHLFYITYERGYGLLRSDEQGSVGNSEGFSARIAGYKDVSSGFVNGVSGIGSGRTFYWLAGEYTSTLGAGYMVYDYNPNSGILGINKESGDSVRCVKD